MADPAKVLEEDLRWREEEIASLKLLASRASKGSVQQRALLRALWAMLYAHYEGFCKFAWDFYLEILSQIVVARQECCEPLARFSLARRFQNLRQDLSLEALWKFATADFAEWMKEQLNFELNLETKSNLWPNLLAENSSAIDLPSNKGQGA